MEYCSAWNASVFAVRDGKPLNMINHNFKGDNRDKAEMSAVMFYINKMELKDKEDVVEVVTTTAGLVHKNKIITDIARLLKLKSMYITVVPRDYESFKGIDSMLTTQYMKLQYVI